MNPSRAARWRPIRAESIFGLSLRPIRRRLGIECDPMPNFLSLIVDWQPVVELQSNCEANAKAEAEAGAEVGKSWPTGQS